MLEFSADKVATYSNQMPPDYVIFACFCLLLYLYINQSIQFRSTASAIRSVFSGDCRMTCRQSEVSGFSGLSGLQGPGPSQSPRQNHGGVFNCVCETCPCALIENFLRTCSPATRTYTLVTAMISEMYINFIQSMHEAYEYIHNVRQCGASCQKPQFISQYPSKDNSSFKDRDKNFVLKLADDSLQASEGKISKTSLVSKKSNTFIKELFHKKKTNAKEATEPKSDSSDEPGNETISAAVGSGCPKCVNEGKTCLPKCPNAKK